MFARINFLFGLGLLVLIAFYFAGVYLLILPLSMVAPNWVRPVAGLAILAAVGVTVQLLSMAMSDLRGVALYQTGERRALSAYASQVALALGHVALFYFASSLLREGKPVATLPLLLIAALYLVGIGLAIGDWRHRRSARPG